jgi:protein TonB
VAPIAAEATTSIEKPVEAATAVSPESGTQTAPSSAPAKRDYGWLSETILRRVEELKRYPSSARVDRAEGRVVVRAVINEDGSVGDVEVSQSSGHQGLDKAAVETMRQAAPFELPRPLGQPRMTIKIPMNYRLDQ